MDEERKSPCWSNITITVPTITLDVLEGFACAADVEPGVLATLCLMQGFALQLRDNGAVALCDSVLELACVLAERVGVPRARHTRLPDLAEETVH